MDKNTFRTQLGEALEKNGIVRPGLMGRPSDARKATINRGLSEGWLCEWPDCCNEEYHCGTKFGCILVPERNLNG